MSAQICIFDKLYNVRVVLENMIYLNGNVESRTVADPQIEQLFAKDGSKKVD